MKWQVNRSHPRIDGTEKRNPAVQRARAPPRSNLRQMMARAETLLSITWLASFTPQFSDQLAVRSRGSSHAFKFHHSHIKMPNARIRTTSTGRSSHVRAPNKHHGQKRAGGRRETVQARPYSPDGVCVPFIIYPPPSFTPTRVGQRPGWTFGTGLALGEKKSICNNE